MTSGTILWGLDAADFKIIGLVAFFGIFMIVLLRLVFARSDRYRRAARLPLEDDDAPRGESPGGGSAGAGRSQP